MRSTTPHLGLNIRLLVVIAVLPALVLPFLAAVPEAEAAFTGTCTVFQSVSQSSDDAQQSGTTVTTTGTTIGAELDATNEWVGIRFQNIDIPQSATINEAYIKLVANSSTLDEPLVTVYMEDADNPSTFTTGNSNISNRTRTSGISWDSTNLAADGASYHDTPDLSTIVQDVVDRGGWAAGNSMVFIIQGGSNGVRDLTVEPFDNAGGNPPILYISYTDSVDSCLTSGVVSLNSDDAQQVVTTMALSGSTIGSGLDATNEWIGLRFTMNVPNGVVVTSAYLSLVPTATDQDSPVVTIYMEDSDDTGTFTVAASDISNRSRTSGVTWSSSDLGATGSSYEDTVDISSLVQSVIDRPGWNEGQEMSVIMQGGNNTSRDLTIKARDGAGETHAYLFVEYEEAAAAAPTVTTDAASSVGSSTITFNGNITDTGDVDASDRGFAYGTSSDLSVAATSTSPGTYSTGTFSLVKAGLDPNTTYYFRAFATNTNGTGFGSIASTTTLPDVPGAPEFSDVTQTTLTVSWDAPTGGADSYKLERCTDSGCSSPLEVYDDTSLSYEDSTLSSNTEYWYRVRASNESGDGEYSAITSTSTLVAVEPEIQRIIRLKGGLRLKGGIRLR